jgi:hypothetical protein
LSRTTGLLFLVAAAGFFLYLWPAIRAPVVVWSDSTLDLAWARAGEGITAPPPTPPGNAPLLHSAKPGWLLFLRAVLTASPERTGERTVVVLQSLLVWLSIVLTAFLAERRRSGIGVPLLVVLLLLLRLRDMSSAILPEALSAALLLPLVAWALDPPRFRGALLLFGLAIGVLFWIRPNVGGVALVIAAVGIARGRGWKAATTVLGGFVLLVAPVWIATRPRNQEETLRGLAHAVVFGSADYHWNPGLGRLAEGRSRQEVERIELEQAKDNWKKLFRGRGPDVRRQVVWRALHGILGAEFYDPRWSPAYTTATFLSRVVTPFLTLLSIAVLVTSRLAGNRGASSLGLVLVALLVLQDVFLISNPRFVLPFLPALYFLAVASAAPRASLPQVRTPVGVLLVILIAFVAMNRYVLDWEWGRIEKAGVALRQRIPIRSLPSSEPATLHLRIASPIAPADAGFEVRGPAGESLYSSTRDGRREGMAITIPLPASVLVANSRRDVEIELVSVGSFDESNYLMFPVIPPPWGRPARRVGSSELSPTTGIPAGSLDWWAHAGAE